MQYYVPYLSAIQIHTNISVVLFMLASLSVNSLCGLTMEVFWMFRSLFVLQEPEEVVETESSDWWIDSESEKLLSRSMSNDSSKTWEDVPEDSPRDRLGYLDFKYIERDPPYKRFPLTYNVCMIYHGLVMYKTRTVSVLLTDSSFADNVVGGYDSNNKNNGETRNPIAYLPLFCLATYKMQGDLWRKTGFDQDRLIYLQSAADSWLKQLSDDHHDNNFINF
ncbi:hypothetical protein IGI04_028029 [Brassica rapa subsp. trilocularis]|uniref:Uncharacterized protein n=1 Tax=Brassica rapa subsp. trilocularis TaxID=1813537 RepID=A0ABQ7L1S2_BRACM|nr:hypothetical protein IGI04_028029 [Brassica rapa subsp. trilocularis]